MKKKKDNLKDMVIGIIILDVIAIINLVMQIYLKDISYFSLIFLFISNFIVFGYYFISKKGHK